MELQKIKITSLTPHPANYNRHPDAQIDELVKSLDQFDQFKNIVVSRGVIVAGHGLVEAAKRRGMTEIYALVRDDLTDEQQRALLLADNILPTMAIPDSESLQALLASLSDAPPVPGLTEETLQALGITTEEEGITNDTYTKKITAPIYEPVNEKPPISELFDDSKIQTLIQEIKASTIPKAEKDFLIEAAQRHTVFNYHHIADYYAHSSKEVQELMEKSALVIIDFEKAIENGYTEICQEILSEYLEEYPNDHEE